MNTDTGEIVPMESVLALSDEQRKKFIPVERDLTAQETLNRQIELYSPCACGSGKKFKFCCKT